MFSSVNQCFQTMIIIESMQLKDQLKNKSKLFLKQKLIIYTRYL